MRKITIDEPQGIKAIIGRPKGNFKSGKCAAGTQVVSFLFPWDKGLTMTKAKNWFDKNGEGRRNADG
ncbi:MAG: hypothetical protein ABR879_04435 [Methanomassiliicoccales archaeon]|jgi:hypothetical protein